MITFAGVHPAHAGLAREGGDGMSRVEVRAMNCLG